MFNGSSYLQHTSSLTIYRAPFTGRCIYISRCGGQHMADVDTCTLDTRSPARALTNFPERSWVHIKKNTCSSRHTPVDIDRPLHPGERADRSLYWLPARGRATRELCCAQQTAGISLGADTCSHAWYAMVCRRPGSGLTKPRGRLETRGPPRFLPRSITCSTILIYSESFLTIVMAGEASRPVLQATVGLFKLTLWLWED